MRFAVFVAFVVVVSLWGVTHLWPEDFGTCREVALNIGEDASVRECRAYGVEEFVVPLAVLGFLVILGGGFRDFEFEGLGIRFKGTREVQKAAQTLREEGETIDQRGEQFLETITSDAQDE